jgi:hypothetical protein
VAKVFAAVAKQGARSGFRTLKSGFSADELLAALYKLAGAAKF